MLEFYRNVREMNTNIKAIKLCLKSKFKRLLSKLDIKPTHIVKYGTVFAFISEVKK